MGDQILALQCLIFGLWFVSKGLLLPSSWHSPPLSLISLPPPSQPLCLFPSSSSLQVSRGRPYLTLQRTDKAAPKFGQRAESQNRGPDF